MLAVQKSIIQKRYDNKRQTTKQTEAKSETKEWIKKTQVHTWNNLRKQCANEGEHDENDRKHRKHRSENRWTSKDWIGNTDTYSWTNETQVYAERGRENRQEEVESDTWHIKQEITNKKFKLCTVLKKYSSHPCVIVFTYKYTTTFIYYRLNDFTGRFTAAA